jgi:hypothetical protein
MAASGLECVRVYPSVSARAVSPAVIAGRWTASTLWMCGMLGFIALVSAADLWLTLTYLTTGGMSEGNPIARWIIGLNSSWVLGLFKVALVSFTCVVLWKARSRRSAQIAAAVGCVMMAWLCFRWHGYTSTVATEVAALNELTEAPVWVRIEN